MITDASKIQKIISESFAQPKAVSVMVNTRKRFGELKDSVSSIMDNARDSNNVEVIVRADEDDPDTVNRLHELPVKVLVGERVGYGRAQESFMDMVNVASGEFCLVWSDDFWMRTPYWDDFFTMHRNQLCIIYSNKEVTNAIHRSIPLVWEKFGIWYCVDVFYKLIALELGIYVRHTDLVIQHEHRGTTRDYVESQIDYEWWNRTAELYEISDVLRPFVNPSLFTDYAPITDKYCNSWGSPIWDRNGKLYWGPGGRYERSKIYESIDNWRSRLSR